MKKKIMTLMMGMLLLLTACGQAKDSSASTMLPVAAVQSAAQAIAPVEDKTQEDVEILPAEEGGEEAEPAGGEDTPNPAVDVETPSAKTEETPSAPNGGEQPRRRCGHSIALSHESCVPRQYAGHPATLRIDSKRRRRLQEKRMAMGHKRDDHEEAQLYHVNDNTMR